MNADWLLGFIEGEGNFYIRFSTRKNKKGKNIVSPQLLFQILVAEKSLLDRIQRFLASKQIKANLYKSRYYYKGLKKEPRIKKDHWLLQVGRRKAIHNLIKLLSPLEWYSEKFSSFKGWKKVSKLAYPRPCSKDRLMKIAEIATHANSNKGKRKWTPQFVEDNCVEGKDGKVRVSYRIEI